MQEFFTPQTTNTEGAVGDVRILADVLSEDLKSGTLLDIGSGEGLVVIGVATRRADVSIFGFEIDSFKCDVARNNIEGAGLTERVQIICADVFKTKLPISDAICCNPPLLPDEHGFSSYEGITQNLFWKSLIEKINREEVSPLIYLHLFDFHGINHRTGEQPCLEEVASTTGFSVATLYRGIRQIGENSRVRYNLPQLANYFPEGIIVVDDSEIPIHRFLSSYINTVTTFIFFKALFACRVKKIVEDGRN